MCGKTRQDMTRNDMISEREGVGVVSIVEKMVEIRLRWVEHLERRHKFCVKCISDGG